MCQTREQHSHVPTVALAQNNLEYLITYGDTRRYVSRMKRTPEGVEYQRSHEEVVEQVREMTLAAKLQHDSYMNQTDLLSELTKVAEAAVMS